MLDFDGVPREAWVWAYGPAKVILVRQLGAVPGWSLCVAWLPWVVSVWVEASLVLTAQAYEDDTIRAWFGRVGPLGGGAALMKSSDTSPAGLAYSLV